MRNPKPVMDRGGRVKKNSTTKKKPDNLKSYPKYIQKKVTPSK